MARFGISNDDFLDLIEAALDGGAQAIPLPDGAC